MHAVLTAGLYRNCQLRSLPAIRRFLDHPHTVLVLLLVHDNVKHPFMPKQAVRSADGDIERLHLGLTTGEWRGRHAVKLPVLVGGDQPAFAILGEGHP